MLFFFQLLKHVTIPQAGVLPRIHPELLQKKKGSSSSSHSSAHSSGAAHSTNGSRKSQAGGFSGPPSSKAAATKVAKAADKLYDISNVDKANVAPKSPSAQKSAAATAALSVASQAKVGVIFHTYSLRLRNSRRDFYILGAAYMRFLYRVVNSKKQLQKRKMTTVLNCFKIGHFMISLTQIPDFVKLNLTY